jgi:hypothetical protein
MHLAAFAGQLGVCRYLWDRGSKFVRATVRAKGFRGMTPMFAAAEEDHVAVCAWLLSVGGAGDDVRVASAGGITPMWVACRGSPRNHCLAAAQWLFAHGASGDVRAVDSASGQSPLHAACENGHLPVARWLCAEGVGAAGDACAPDRFGRTPMESALRGGHTDLAVLLVAHGAAVTAGARSNAPLATLVAAVVPSDKRPLVRAQLAAAFQRVVAAHRAFASMVLPVVCLRETCRQLAATSSSTCHTSCRAAGRSSGVCEEERPTPPAACALPLLRGHEQTILPLVADFAGVVRGQQLRNTREALGVLL